MPEPPDPSPLATSSEEAALPRTFGRYTLFELVGRGGMAEIFLARQETDLGATRLAVVKQILPAFAADPRFAAMLTHEAKLAAQLNHARIVQVFDLGRANDHLFIAMEYVEGFDLNALLRQCTEQKVGLPIGHALGIVADVLEGLDYAHRRTDDEGRPLGIVHRDVSPSNVLISFEGEVKLCDFGIAHANDLVREGAAEALKGKAGYMSPEHARGEAIDARSDVFAAGIILWELLAGHRLYRPRDGTTLLEQARLAEIPPLPDKGLPHGEELERIVLRALARDPEARYPTASAMLRDLEGYLAENGLLASRLKLREWVTSSFGTGLVERRRASERRLPKTIPPPRAARTSSVAPAPPSPSPSPPPPSAPPAVPSSGSVIPVPLDDGGDEAEIEPSTRRPRALPIMPISNGAMRAFRRELEVPPLPPEADPGGYAEPVVRLPPSSFLGPTPPPSPPKSLQNARIVALAVAVMIIVLIVIAQKLGR